MQRSAGNHAVVHLLASRAKNKDAAVGVQRSEIQSDVHPVSICEPSIDSPPQATDIVLFPNAESTLTSEHHQQIDNLVYNWHASGDQPEVRVDGYASTPGEEALNQSLACARANNVAAELKHPSSGVPGIPDASIATFMHGEVKVFGSEAQNRRVSIYIEPSRPAPVPTPTSPSVSPWWPDGPTVALKTKSTTLGQYVTWVREVETKYANREDVVHRLRRLYYSTQTQQGPKELNANPAGDKFDALIAGSMMSPLTSPPLSLATLNGLFETDTIETPAGETLDLTHILPALDIQLQGATPLGTGLEMVSGSPLSGVFTWTGDLGSWFVEWIDQKKKQPDADDIALLFSCANVRTPLNDLLADMDAQIMVENEITTTVDLVPVPAAGMDPIEDLKSTLNRPLSDILQSYYGTPAKGAGPAPSPNQQRFVRFVQASNPRIPYDTPDASKPLEIKLAADAEEKIYDAVYAATEALLEGNNTVTRGGTPDSLEENEHLVRLIAQRFRTFLESGLATGSAPWP